MAWIYLDVEEILKETEAAILCRLDDGEEVWLPLSQIADSGDYVVGDKNCTVSVTEWLAKQKGLA